LVKYSLPTAMFSLNVRKCAVAAMGFTAKDKLFIKLLCMSICGAGYRSWVKVKE